VSNYQLKASEKIMISATSIKKASKGENKNTYLVIKLQLIKP